MASRKGKSYIQLNLEGFDELLKKIEDAGGSINGAVDSCMRQSAQVQQKELKAQMHKASPKPVSTALINRMPPPEIDWNGNACTARVGYKKGSYDPKKLSDGYKATFINYGTPRIAPREFIKKAKAQARPQIKKEQQKTLEKILGRLSK